MDDSLAAFLPRFAILARQRIQNALDVATSRRHADTAFVAHELHSLAGEAGLLGLAGLVPIARDAEEKAKRVHSTHSDDDADALAAALNELSRAVERVSPA